MVVGRSCCGSFRFHRPLSCSFGGLAMTGSLLGIWHRRNCQIHSKFPVVDVEVLAWLMLSSLDQIAEEVASGVRRDVKWEPPDLGHILNIKASYSVEVAEALALLQGFKLAVEAHLIPVVSESDSLIVVKLLCSKVYVLSELCLALESTKLALSLTEDLAWKFLILLRLLFWVIPNF
ncbi:hypothetical protein ACOSQ2_023749 [Xanthoceras sorbifolium]